MRFGGGEFSTGTTGNFQPELTLGGLWGERELVHDFIFRRLELPWAAFFNGDNVPACSVGRGTHRCFQ
ncbi:MAG TPA: hypothetical protein VGF61_21080 [Candidatus Acidoferrum sp.]